jgi:outer membrane protein insertion porin family
MIFSRIWLILFFLFLFIGICGGEEDLIYKITILGNVKVEEGVIQGAVKSREGRMFSTEQVREDLRSIFNLGYFTDVQVDIKSTPKGKEVIFIVIEKPPIKEVLITGNQKVKLADIKEKVTLTPRSILNLEKVKENAEQIRKFYFSKGYYGVKIDNKIDYLESNEAVVTFKIIEGPKGHIKKITFKGNKHIKSSDLRKVMITKQWNLLSLISKTGVLDEDILKNDLQLLTAYYIDHGYLDVKVSEPKIDFRDPKKTRIEIDIVEGQLYRFGNIDFRGDILTTKEDLFKVIKIKRNDTYSNTAIQENISDLTMKFANDGYAYVEITPETSLDPKNLLVHLTFDIEKKKRVSFEKIQIVGNTKTREKVIRRELQIAEGEIYNANGLNKSRDRLRRTGYFKEVDFSTSRGSTDEKINLDMKVEEAPTGSFSFGVGYSSLDKVTGAAAVADRNLFGLGYSALLRFQLGKVSRDVRFSFTDPYFLGYRYAAGFDLYNEKRDWDYYSYKITGGDIRFGKELTETIRADMTYKLEDINVYNVSNYATLYVKEQEGKKTTSALSLSLSTDTRDDYYAPTRGARHSFYIENAGGILGGDNYFVKAGGETSWYFPMPLKTVLNLRGQVGALLPYGGRLAPIYEKFFVGGIQTVRGFKYGYAGPLDINNEPLGSEKMVAFNSELIFPMSREIGLRGAVFWDVGKGFDKFSDFTPLKTGIGVGIRWFSPIGPIHIDLGFNPIPKKGEKRMVLDFTGGTAF